jgi:hypothetical protein
VCVCVFVCVCVCVCVRVSVVEPWVERASLPAATPPMHAKAFVAAVFSASALAAVVWFVLSRKSLVIEDDVEQDNVDAVSLVRQSSAFASPSASPSLVDIVRRLGAASSAQAACSELLTCMNHSETL